MFDRALLGRQPSSPALEFVPGRLEFFFQAQVFFEAGTGDILYAYFLGDENPDGVEVSLGSIHRDRRRIIMDVTTAHGLAEFLIYIIDHEAIHWALRIEGEAVDYAKEEVMVDRVMRTFFIRPFE